MKRTKQEENGEVKSPCVKRCSLGPNRICPECFRSIDEIVSWPDADNVLRRKILETARLRRLRTERKLER